MALFVTCGIRWLAWTKKNCKPKAVTRWMELPSAMTVCIFPVLISQKVMASDFPRSAPPARPFPQPDYNPPNPQFQRPMMDGRYWGLAADLRWHEGVCEVPQISLFVHNWFIFSNYFKHLSRLILTGVWQVIVSHHKFSEENVREMSFLPHRMLTTRVILRFFTYLSYVLANFSSTRSSILNNCSVLSMGSFDKPKTRGEKSRIWGFL